MERSEILQGLREVLCVSGVVRDMEQVTEHTDLIKDYHVNSMKMVSLLVEIEEKFKIEIDIEELTLKIISKIGNLIGYLEKVIEPA